MYRHYTAVRSVPRKLRAIEEFSHKGESVKRGSTVFQSPVQSSPVFTDSQLHSSSNNSSIFAV